MSTIEHVEHLGIADRSPEAVLEFWLGRLRSPADASRENWQQGMRRWRAGPFARSTVGPNDLGAFAGPIDSLTGVQVEVTAHRGTAHSTPWNIRTRRSRRS